MLKEVLNWIGMEVCVTLNSHSGTVREGTLRQMDESGIVLDIGANEVKETFIPMSAILTMHPLQLKLRAFGEQ
jgi:hypothetical protein